jgi:hypothetical protein
MTQGLTPPIPRAITYRPKKKVSFLSKLPSGQTDLISYTTRLSSKKGDTFKWMIEDIQMLVGIQMRGRVSELPHSGVGKVWNL